MLRLLIISILLVAAKSETSVNEVLGEWLPVATYPARTNYKMCLRFNISLDDNLKCTCGDAAVPVLNFHYPKQKSIVVPVLFIDKTEEVTPKLSTVCSCNGDYPVQVVLRKINPNYLVYYATIPGGTVPNVSNVFLKNMPKLSELKAVLNSIPDLSGREPGYLCEDSAFLNE